MKTIHYFSGITIALFVGLHIVNHLMVLHSTELHISFMQVTRKFYRHPVIETILFAAVLIQISSGIMLVTQKWSRLETVFDWIHILSGLYMSLFLIIHITAVIIGRYKLQLDTNIWYGAGVMNLWPHKLFFIPYYIFALLAFFFHVACIHRIKMQILTSVADAEKQSYIIMLVGIIITTAIIVKMSNLKLPAEFIKATQETKP